MAGLEPRINRELSYIDNNGALGWIGTLLPFVRADMISQAVNFRRDICIARFERFIPLSLESQLKETPLITIHPDSVAPIVLNRGEATAALLHQFRSKMVGLLRSNYPGTIPLIDSHMADPLHQIVEFKNISTHDSPLAQLEEVSNTHLLPSGIARSLVDRIIQGENTARSLPLLDYGTISDPATCITTKPLHYFDSIIDVAVPNDPRMQMLDRIIMALIGDGESKDEKRSLPITTLKLKKIAETLAFRHSWPTEETNLILNTNLTVKRYAFSTKIPGISLVFVKLQDDSWIFESSNYSDKHPIASYVEVKPLSWSDRDKLEEKYRNNSY